MTEKIRRPGGDRAPLDGVANYESAAPLAPESANLQAAPAASQDGDGIPAFLDRRLNGITPANNAAAARSTSASKPLAPEADIARPLHVLVPLIRDDLKQGDEAAARAGLPYYRAAGEKMIEAKVQMRHGEFGPWIKRNLRISQTQANLYMSYARATGRLQNNGAPGFSSLRDFERRHLRGENKVDVDLLNRRQAEMKRVEERDAQRKLALQLINIGYKALATKLHPDKGGSRDAMARLNQVRDRLRSAS